MDAIELLVLVARKVYAGKIRQMVHHVWKYLKLQVNVIPI
jgi:hypothetical protein